ncbi:MAG: Gfo/Idh/MocA family oxidoreductase [Pseudomonadota bacterium]
MASPSPEKENSALRIALVGLGYFSQFHLAAWNHNPDCDLVAVCDVDEAKGREAAKEYDCVFDRDLDAILANQSLDLLDLVVPPSAQAKLIRMALRRVGTIICQKPFCTSLQEAETIVHEAEEAGTQLIIHENFRFQPWHRSAKLCIGEGMLGEIYQCRFALRPGDGQGDDAYLARQPSFQKMERFLVQETAVHLIDVFRFLFGDIRSVYADLRQLNPVIAGEDAGFLLFDHENGARSQFDGNRLADHASDNPRRTMGEMEIIGEKGTLLLTGDGCLRFRRFQETNFRDVPTRHKIDDTSFGGGCVANLIDHVVDCTRGNLRPENTAREYLDVIRLVEVCYRSSETGTKLNINKEI